MELHDVRVDLPSNTPVVLLKEELGEGRTLPIYIGSPEAQAIVLAMKGTVTERPFTHDLMRDLLVALGASVERVVITELRNSIYFAELHLVAGGRVIEVSSRPSDAIALAARTGTPIFCNDELLEAEGVILHDLDVDDEDGDDDDVDAESLVEEFNNFIEHIRPEDFTKDPPDAR
jgi:uncharacterized protein